jgi:hypothetical protein
MTVRNRSLLDLAHYCPCMVDLPHPCVGYQGCEPAHGDWAFTGRGMGHKAHDNAFAAACRNAHELLSPKVNDPMTRDEKREAWLRAHFKTMAFIWDHGWVTVNTKKARQEGTCA